MLLKIDQKLHRYDQISGRRCLWSLRQMLSPSNDSWICGGYVHHRFWDFFHFASIAGCACEFHFGTFRGNFKHCYWPHLIPCTNNNKACLIFYVSVNSKPDHAPGQFFLMGEFPTPGQKRVQTPTLRAYKNELKPHPRGHYPQLFTIKTWKNETEVM